MRSGSVTVGGRVSMAPQESGNCPDEAVRVEGLVVEDRLDLEGVDAVIEVTSTYSADAGHMMTVNDEIRSSGGTLVLSLTGYRDVDFEEEGDDAGLVLDYDAAECFSVGGSGSMELDIELRTASCVEVSLSETGGCSRVGASWRYGAFYGGCGARRFYPYYGCSTDGVQGYGVAIGRSDYRWTASWGGLGRGGVSVVEELVRGCTARWVIRWT